MMKMTITSNKEMENRCSLFLEQSLDDLDMYFYYVTCKNYLLEFVYIYKDNDAGGLQV